MSIRRFIVTTLIETDDSEGDYKGDPSGSYVHDIDFGRGGYYDNILESSVLEIAPWDDGEER
jgi:hypothetical protein